MPEPRRRRLKRFSTPNPMGLVLVLIPILVGLAFLVDVIRMNGWRIPVSAQPLALLIVLMGALFVWDQRRVGGLKMWRRTRLRIPARLRFRAERAAKTCLFCRDALGEEVLQPCPGCGAVAHADCRAEAGRCGTLGCAEASQQVRLVHPERSKQTT